MWQCSEISKFFQNCAYGHIVDTDFPGPSLPFLAKKIYMLFEIGYLDGGQKILIVPPKKLGGTN